MSEPFGFLRCRLAEGSVGVPQSCVRGLQGIDLLQRIPRPGPLVGWLLGLQPEVPVYDLSVLLGLPPSRSGDEATVVLYGCDGDLRGLLVGATRRVSAADSAVLARPRLLERADFAAWLGVIFDGEDVLPCLDPSRLHDDLALCGMISGGAAPIARRPLPRASVVAAKALTIFEAGEGIGGHGSDSSFALSVSQVLEVVDLGTLVPLPGGPPYLLGLIDWRGRAVPLVDLSAALEADRNPARPCVPRRAIIARTLDPTDCIALAVSGEIEMKRLPLEGQSVEAPEGVPLLGCAEIDGRVILIPDLEWFFSLAPEGRGLAA